MARSKKSDAPPVGDVEDLLGDSMAATEAAPAAAPPAEKPKKAKKKATTLADLIDDTAAPKKPKAKKPAAAPVAAKPKAKAKKASAAERAERGTGKFYFPADSDEFKAVRTAALRLKSATGTREFAEKQEVDTWKARLVLAALVKEGRGKLKRASGQRELTYTPA